jgi:hypothetical protein
MPARYRARLPRAGPSGDALDDDGATYSAAVAIGRGRQKRHFEDAFDDR